MPREGAKREDNMNPENNQVLSYDITNELIIADSFVVSGKFNLAFYHFGRAHAVSTASQLTNR